MISGSYSIFKLFGYEFDFGMNVGFAGGGSYEFIAACHKSEPRK